MFWGLKKMKKTIFVDFSSILGQKLHFEKKKVEKILRSGACSLEYEVCKIVLSRKLIIHTKQCCAS